MLLGKADTLAFDPDHGRSHGVWKRRYNLVLYIFVLMGLVCFAVFDGASLHEALLPKWSSEFTGAGIEREVDAVLNAAPLIGQSDPLTTKPLSAGH